MKASASGHLAVVRVLLAAVGCDVNTVANTGFHALWLARTWCRADVVAALLDAGALPMMHGAHMQVA